MSAPITDDDLAWTVEEACRNARPATMAIGLGGWVLRASGGPTRRTNSLNPLRGHRDDPGIVLAEAEAIYRGLGRPLIVRVPDLAPEMDALLDRLGYGAEGETRTLLADLARLDVPEPAEIGVSPDPDEAWLSAQAACEGATSEEAKLSLRASLDGLILPRRFVHRPCGDAPVAVAYGVLHRGLLVLEAVATHPEHRRQGHARALVLSLMGWARSRGATAACLQVIAANDPARALYGSLGFDRDLYGYRYRRRD